MALGAGWGKPLAPGAQVRPAQIAPAMPGSEAPASLRVQPGRWKKGQLLGTGSFGSVYKGLNLDTGAMIAVKVLLVPTCVHSQASTTTTLCKLSQVVGAQTNVLAQAKR